MPLMNKMRSYFAKKNAAEGICKFAGRCQKMEETVKDNLQNTDIIEKNETLRDGLRVRYMV